MSFRIGQRVRVVGSTAYPKLIGTLATVVGALRETECGSRTGRYKIGTLVHDIDSDYIGRGLYGTLVAAPYDIEPIDTDDSRTVTTWSALADVWKPAVVSVRGGA